MFPEHIEGRAHGERVGTGCPQRKLSCGCSSGMLRGRIIAVNHAEAGLALSPLRSTRPSSRPGVVLGGGSRGNVAPCRHCDGVAFVKRVRRAERRRRPFVRARERKRRKCYRKILVAQNDSDSEDSTVRQERSAPRRMNGLGAQRAVAASSSVARSASRAWFTEPDTAGPRPSLLQCWHRTRTAQSCRQRMGSLTNGDTALAFRHWRPERRSHGAGGFPSQAKCIAAYKRNRFSKPRCASGIKAYDFIGQVAVHNGCRTGLSHALGSAPKAVKKHVASRISIPRSQNQSLLLLVSPCLSSRLPV